MRRRVLVAAALAVVGFAILRLTVVRPAYIGGYRQIDEYNIALQVIGANPTWRGVTELTETDSAVTVAVSHVTFEFGAGFGDERIAYVAVRLNEPLGGRDVIDATSGTAVPYLSQ
jgi:hypothetical protein